MITVLVLASSPMDQGQLHLGREHKVIQETLDRARNRDQFRVISCMASTVDDLRSRLLEYLPTVIHFCGHGAGSAGLCFEDADGNTHLVSGSSLAKLLHLVSDDLKCVLLNACFSEEQARPISEHIDFVVGMRDSIGDQAALKFAEGFYQAFWAGQPFERSFKFACSAIDTAGLPDEEIPILLRSPRLGSQVLPYGERIQEIEVFLLRYVNSPLPERLDWTVEGPAVLPAATEYYADARLGAASSVTVVDLRAMPQDTFAVSSVLRYGNESIEYIHYLTKTTDGWRLQWKATAGYWTVPARTLTALGATEPVEIRAIVRISDYYNYEYSPGEYLSVELNDLYDGSIHGFMPRSHPQFGPLLAILKDGHRHRLTLTVRLDHPGRRVVDIVELLGDSWVLTANNS